MSGIHIILHLYALFSMHMFNALYLYYVLYVYGDCDSSVLVLMTFTNEGQYNKLTHANCIL